MANRIEFTRNFPYSEIRPLQQEVLEQLENNYDKYDVFVLQAPTAAGKSALARTIMNSLRSVSLITPTNMLVNQFLQEFPDTPTLHRLDSYYCEEWKRPCMATRKRLAKFCPGCNCGKQWSTAKYQQGPGVYNYHTYLAHKIFRQVLVVDEAHNLIPTIRDRLALQMWKHDYKYSSNMWKNEQVLEWIAGMSPAKRKSKKVIALKEAAQYQVPEYVWQRTRDWFNGKGTTRGDPEERELIKLSPVDISNAPPLFWPGFGRPGIGNVQKVILLSATIGPKDIEQLGLDKKRVCYIQCKSPIPAESRPIVPLNLLSVNRTSIDTRLPDIARAIQLITDDHPGEKGVVHVTYKLSNLLQQYLTGSRFLFHNKDNKADVYREFRESPVDQGKVLVASGMYEGLDLPEDLGRWQIIAKVPWGSLESPAIKHLAQLDPDWYTWETLKTTIQACGRICRTPKDRGTTFVLDSTWTRLLSDGKHMLPEWFQQAIVHTDDSEGYKINLKL